MAGRISKNKKQSKTPENGNRRLAQILFAIFAIILILSMVLSAVTNY
jgi:heme/copper-type cytochrome/quinol oxidase subunit 2